MGHTYKETVSSIYSLEKASLHFHTLSSARAHTHTHEAASRSRERAPVLNGWLIFLNVTQTLEALGIYNRRRLLLSDCNRHAGGREKRAISDLAFPIKFR